MEYTYRKQGHSQNTGAAQSHLNRPADFRLMPGPGYITFDKAVYLFFFNYLQPEETLRFPSWTACGDNLKRALSISRQRVMGEKSQTCSKTFILPDYITQIGRAVDDNNNNEDVIKVKYLILTRLKAEYSNLIIMAGCSALNQQLLWENTPILMC